nr:MAG TPA: antirepressor protein [Caudoviricetes sp.]
MSSREIAEITGKQHRNVMRDCDKLNEHYEKLGMLKIEQGSYVHENTGNQQHRECLLTKMQTMDLMTGYNTELRIRVNRRWEELENKQVQKSLPGTFAEALRAYADEVEKNEKLVGELKVKNVLIAEYEPKVTYYDQILASVDTITITQIAKDYGMSAQELNKLLHEQGIQYKQNKQWILYQKYAKLGYTKSKTVPITYKNGEQGVALNTQWTQKGRLFLYELLKSHGYLPLIEQDDENI